MTINPYQSTTVKSKRRAGRAPYNFVSLAAQARWVAPPPACDRYGCSTETLYSGEVEFEISALTDFYVRGMWSWSDFVTPISREDGDNHFRRVNEQKLPFAVNGRLRLPGTSIRGLLRSMVEIIGEAPLDPVNDQRFSYRAVADAPNPTRADGSPNPNFDPLAPNYKSIMRKVKAGYFIEAGGEWIITVGKKEGKFYRVVDPGVFTRYEVEFNDSACLPGTYGQAPEIPNGQWRSRGSSTPTGWQHGWFIASGPMENKTHNWVIEEPDPLNAIVVSKADWDLHAEAGITTWIQDAINKGEIDPQGGVPCFFSECTIDGYDHIFFGPTRNFRVPYRRRLCDAVPPRIRRPDPCPAWDLAQSIFGRTTRSVSEKGQRSRVFIEDAIHTGSVPLALKEEKTIVAGEPKPTTFQHYLLQTNDSLAASVTWDLDDAVVRGHKLYWHRPGAGGRIREAGSRQLERGTATTIFTPAASGATFAARIRFENLRNYELGALLTTIDLPPGCAHHLGMCKPLGLGSFEFRKVMLRVFSREMRYASFFENASCLSTGLIEDRPSIASFKRDFATWYLQADLNLWDTPRFQELKALLTFQPHATQDDWLAITRYLEFGKLHGESYNEYLATQPPPRKAKDKRRPLPPALQVWRVDPEIPRDPRPDFEEP